MEMWSDSPASYNQNPRKNTPTYQTDSSDDFWGDYTATSDSYRTSGTLQRAQGSSRIKRKNPLATALTAVGVLGGLLLAFALWGLLSGRPEETPSMGAPPEVTAAVPPIIEQEEIIPVVTVPVPQKEYRYFGRMLTSAQKAIYDQIQEGVAVHADNIGPFNVATLEEAQMIIRSVTYDYPEYFWFRGAHNSSYFDKDTYLEYTFCPEYEFSAGEYAGYAAFVENATQPILTQLAGKSDYEKVKGVYEYLIDTTIYDRAYMGKSIYEMFLDGRAVCEGYARATQYLLTKLDVECLYLTGIGGEINEPRSSWEDHGWNIVKIDGIYYQLDTTWGDPVNDSGIQTKTFHYLNLPDEEMFRTHEPENWNRYPICTDTYYSYYQYEGNYLHSFSRETITAWFQTAYSTGQPMEFKCANADVYQMVCAWLIDNNGFQELFSSVATSYQYTYTTDDALYILNLRQS